MKKVKHHTEEAESVILFIYVEMKEAPEGKKPA